MGYIGLPGATCTGDTFLRLYSVVSGTSIEVSSNDDAPSPAGTTCSFLTFTAPATATTPLTLRVGQGCYGSTNTCSGTLSFAVTAAAASTGPNPPPLPPNLPGAPPIVAAGAGVLPPFVVTWNSAGATINPVWARVGATLSAGGSLRLGTIGPTGAACVGDTFIRLFTSPTVLPSVTFVDASTLTEVASNDDYAGSSCSQINWSPTSSAQAALPLYVAQGCYGGTFCQGRVAFESGAGVPPVASPPLLFPPAPPDVALAAGSVALTRFLAVNTDSASVNSTTAREALPAAALVPGVLVRVGTVGITGAVSIQSSKLTRVFFCCH